MSPASTSYQSGRLAEDAAALLLTHHSARIVEKNYRARGGEIDLIALDGETLCFIEVRYRRSAAYGGAIASISLQKRRRIAQTALAYLAQTAQLSDRPCRFDVAILQGDLAAQRITWLKNAFEITEEFGMQF